MAALFKGIQLSILLFQSFPCGRNYFTATAVVLCFPILSDVFAVSVSLALPFPYV